MCDSFLIPIPPLSANASNSLFFRAILGHIFPTRKAKVTPRQVLSLVFLIFKILNSVLLPCHFPGAVFLLLISSPPPFPVYNDLSYLNLDAYTSLFFFIFRTLLSENSFVAHPL